MKNKTSEIKKYWIWLTVDKTPLDTAEKSTCETEDKAIENIPNETQKIFLENE